jgi:hypothetical protein
MVFPSYGVPYSILILFPIPLIIISPTTSHGVPYPMVFPTYGVPYPHHIYSLSLWSSSSLPLPYPPSAWYPNICTIINASANRAKSRVNRRLLTCIIKGSLYGISQGAGIIILSIHYTKIPYAGIYRYSKRSVNYNIYRIRESMSISRLWDI